MTRSWSNAAAADTDDTNQGNVRCQTQTGNLTSRLQPTKELEKPKTPRGVNENPSLASLILLGSARSRSTSL